MKKNKKVSRLYPDKVCIVLGFFLGLLVGVAGNMIANSSEEEVYNPARYDLVRITKGFDKGCVGIIKYYNDTLFDGPQYAIDCKGRDRWGYAFVNELEQLIPPRHHETLCIPGAGIKND